MPSRSREDRSAAAAHDERKARRTIVGRLDAYRPSDQPGALLLVLFAGRAQNGRREDVAPFVVHCVQRYEPSLQRPRNPVSAPLSANDHPPRPKSFSRGRSKGNAR